MKPKEFRKYLDRDGEKCLHCGTTEGLVPQHRRNRGMGGSKERDMPSNIIVMCSAFNERIEQDADAASKAVQYGWKVVGMDIPWLARVQLFDVYSGSQVGAGRRSLAFGLTFQAPDRTLTDAEVNEQHARVVRELGRRFGAEVRGG